MREYAGRIVFEEAEVRAGTHPAIAALKGLTFGDVSMPWGFTLQTIDGKVRIIPSAKEEWLAEIQEMIADGGDVHPTVSCRNDSPTTCTGDCIGAVGAPFCKRTYNPSTGRYFCGCYSS